jgi:hypothetical protein
MVLIIGLGERPILPRPEERRIGAGKILNIEMMSFEKDVQFLLFHATEYFLKVAFLLEKGCLKRHRGTAILCHKPMVR